jgi:hypothetical protein
VGDQGDISNERFGRTGVSVELFHMILEVMLGRALDWCAGQILDVRTTCPGCRQRDKNRIGNEQPNGIECSNCHRQVLQFSNACDFTVNRRSGQIGHGIFEVADQKWRWVDHGGLFSVDKRLHVPFNIRVDGLGGRSVFLETAIRQFESEELVASHRSLLEPTAEVWRRLDYSHYFHPNNFSAESRDGFLACDARLVSEFHDVLFEDRRIIKPWQ